MEWFNMKGCLSFFSRDCARCGAVTHTRRLFGAVLIIGVFALSSFGNIAPVLSAETAPTVPSTVPPATLIPATATVPAMSTAPATSSSPARSTALPKSTVPATLTVPATSTGGDEFCTWLNNVAKLYKADPDKNPIIQEFNLMFRLQYQVGWVSPNGDAVGTQGGAYQDEFRRCRLGANAKLFNGKLKVVNFWNVGGLDGRRHNIAPAGEPQLWTNTETAASLNDLYLEYTATYAQILLGCTTPGLTAEYRTSTAALMTVEESAFSRQLHSETNYGIQFKNPGKDDKLGWLLACYLNGMDGGTRADEPNFSSKYGSFLLSNLNYDVSGWITEKGRLWLEYAHNFSDAVDETLPPQSRTWDSSYLGIGAEDIVALSWEAQQGSWEFLAEVLGASNINKNSTGAPAGTTQNGWGIVLRPSYKFTPQWEGVFRYSFAEGKDALRSERRYIASGPLSATRNAAGVCDRMNTFYFGLNYYLCPVNPSLAKFMLGTEYSCYENDKGNTTNPSFVGWSYYAAFRMNF